MELHQQGSSVDFMLEERTRGHGVTLANKQCRLYVRREDQRTWSYISKEAVQTLCQKRGLEDMELHQQGSSVDFMLEERTRGHGVTLARKQCRLYVRREDQRTWSYISKEAVQTMLEERTRGHGVTLANKQCRLYVRREDQRTWSYISKEAVQTLCQKRGLEDMELHQQGSSVDFMLEERTRGHGVTLARKQCRLYVRREDQRTWSYISKEAVQTLCQKRGLEDMELHQQGSIVDFMLEERTRGHGVTLARKQCRLYVRREDQRTWSYISKQAVQTLCQKRGLEDMELHQQGSSVDFMLEERTRGHGVTLANKQCRLYVRREDQRTWSYISKEAVQTLCQKRGLEDMELHQQGSSVDFVRREDQRTWSYISKEAVQT